MSNSYSIQRVAQAVSITNHLHQNSTETDSRKKKKHGKNYHVSLDMIKNSSVDYGSPFEIAREGNLNLLKSYCEDFSGMLKERDEYQATVLHHAAATNQIAVMQYVIESGIELNATNKDGNTALHVATLQQHAEAVSLLLSNGINDEILNLEKHAGLHIAARLNNTAVMAAYMEHTHINIVVSGYRKKTPLHIIAEQDNLEVCEVFNNSVLVQDSFKKKNGFRLCAADDDELTPIHSAARKGSHRVLNFFLTNCKNHGYPAEVVLGFIDEENSTPLHAAIDGGHLKVVEVLLNHGADPMATKDDQVPPFLLACSQGRLEMIQVILSNRDSGEIIFCRDLYGQSCLHRCTQAINSHQSVAYLTSQGAEIDAVDNKGQTALMIAIITGSTQGVSALLERGADITIKDNEGNNVLHHVVHHKRKKILGILLEHPGGKNLLTDRDNKGHCPTHIALSTGLSEMVHAMIASIRQKVKNIKDCNGNNYLHLAAQGGDWKAISILLEIPECAQLINEVNKYGGVPLHFAAFGGHLRSAELLLSHGAMVHKCHYGTTPFMSACYHGQTEVARLLFDAHPFQLKWTADCGDNALHMAASNGSPQIVSFCLDIGVPIILNNNQESFFDRIIAKNHAKAAMAVIQHKRYQEALDLVSPTGKHPMLNLIINMPDVAKQVLDRSLTKSELPRLNKEYWEQFDFKYLRLCTSNHEEPLGAKKNGELTPLEEKEAMDMHTIRYKGSLKTNDVSFSSNITHLETLKTMVKHSRSVLLTHPVTNCFIKTKWRKYGRWIHLTLASFVFLQVFFLLCFTALVPNPTEILRAVDQTNETTPCKDGTNGTIPCPVISHSANLCRFLSLGFAGLNFIIWVMLVFKIRQEALNLTNNLFVLIDFLSVGFTIFYLIPGRGLDNAYWRAGTVATFFTWFSLLLRIQLFDLFGVYITMFLTTTRTVFQVLSICFLFLMAFSLSFYILAGNLKDYSTIGYSLFINFGHLLGEIDYTAFVNEDIEGNLRHDWLTFMFVIVLAILMGIVIMNLLVGLAVGDIEQIRNDAITGKKLVEVTFFSHFDGILPRKLLNRLDKGVYTNYPNHEVTIPHKIWRLLWRYIKGKNPNIDTEDTSTEYLQQDSRSKEIYFLKSKVEELALQQEKIMETLALVRDAQESMLKIITKENEENDDVCEI